MKIKGKRILKNGAIAAYVFYEKEKKWKWRIIGRSVKKIGGSLEDMKGDCEELNRIINKREVIGMGMEAIVYGVKGDETKCIKSYKITPEPSKGAWGKPLRRGGNKQYGGAFIGILMKKLKDYVKLGISGLGVRIYKFFICNDILYILMDRINGETLSELDISSDEKSLIREKFKKNLEKLGIIKGLNGNVHNENIMYDKNLGDFFIIDW